MRILVTGLGTFWGSRLARALEQRDDVEVVVGLDTRDPTMPLERTEFVRADSSYSILQRIVHAAQIDTILHTHLVVDSTQLSGRAMNEINVIGTMNMLAAAGSTDSPVKRIIVKSSTLVYGTDYRDPYFFREEMQRSSGPTTRVERSLLECEQAVRDFAEDNPHVLLTVLRFTNVLGDHLDSSFGRVLRMPVAPEVFGFDPRLQFTHEEDVVRALVYATTHDVPGIYNVAGDGVVTWSEVCKIVGLPRVPLPPVLTTAAVQPLRVLRIADLPPEMLILLRYGRGVDNARFKRAGFQYRYTSAGTVDAFAQSLRLERAVGAHPAPYQYQRDVEAFFRHSPAVMRDEG